MTKPRLTPRRKSKKRAKPHDAYTSANWREAIPTNEGPGFSEESIRRQLEYLVPVQEDSWEYQRRMIAGGECCWHFHPYTGAIWCCGGMCWRETFSDNIVYDYVDNGYSGELDYVQADCQQDDIPELNMLSPGADSATTSGASLDLPEGSMCTPCIAAQSPMAGVNGYERTGHGDCVDPVDCLPDMRKSSIYKQEGVRGLCRDEWDCDFGGFECFCWTVDETIKAKAMAAMQ